MFESVMSMILGFVIGYLILTALEVEEGGAW